MKKFSIKKIVITSTFFAAFLWVVYVFVSHKYMGLDIQIAERGEVQDSIETFGIAVRDEMILGSGSYSKENLKYLFSDGEKIPKNEVIAEIYKSPEEAKASYRIDSIDKEIETLKKLSFSKNNISSNISFINNQINEEIKNLLAATDDVKLIKANNHKQKILYLLSEREIISGKNINLGDKIKVLKDEKERLLSHLPKSASVINSPESGEFVNHTDGYENIVDYKSITSSNFENLNFDDISTSSSNVNQIGKIIKSETWYIICKISNDECSKINVGAEVSVSMPSFDLSLSLPFRVESIAQKSNTSDFIMLLSCDYMNKELLSVRKEKFRINLKEYSGIKISKSAIHKSKNEGNGFETGVFVRSGNYLKFKKAKPIFWLGSDVICSYTSEEANDENYMQPGDNVVVRGTTLYVGKHVK